MLSEAMAAEQVKTRRATASDPFAALGVNFKEVGLARFVRSPCHPDRMNHTHQYQDSESDQHQDLDPDQDYCDQDPSDQGHPDPDR